MPRAYIKTYGCQMNVYDSDRMAETLAAAGYIMTDTPEAADTIILNTCHIREKAAEKIYSELGRLKPLKARNADLVVGVAGCVAQAEGAEMPARAPLVDLVFGPQTYHDLPAMLSAARAKRKSQVHTDFTAAEKFAALDATPRPAAPRADAFVTVQEGCDKFCTFCVVPYTRGGEISRTGDAIYAEVETLAKHGTRAITLLGQNVNAWHDGTTGLAGLLARLATIDGIARLRFTTSHPCDMDDALINAFGDNEKLVPYLHLPVQSGSDKVLAAMNRGYTAAEYLEQVERLRAVRPDLALSSDFIVGFPGETQADFDATMSLVETLDFAQAFSFKYSPRPGTPAAARDDPIDDATAAERLAHLQAVLTRQQHAFNKAQIGRTLPVLFDFPHKNKKRGLHGRSPYMQAVHVASETPEALGGQILPVVITEAGTHGLTGRLEDGLHRAQSTSIVGG